jgi:hypothetical protein
LIGRVDMSTEDLGLVVEMAASRVYGDVDASQGAQSSPLVRAELEF